jgi:REP element-mobilizing transposase RayT
VRQPRDYRPGHLYAVTQRGNHAQWVYRDEADFQKCISLMRRYSRMHHVKIHGYCLLHNHGHWLLEASTPDSISHFMRDLQGQYSRYLNRRYGTTPWILFAPLIEPVQPTAFSRYLRKGPTNWTGRYDAPPLDARGFKAFLKYVEMNAVRAELVKHARDWPWSSASAHCSGKDPHDLLCVDRWEQLYRRPATIAVDWYAYLVACADEEHAARAWKRNFCAAAREHATRDGSRAMALPGRSPPDG